ncbi:MAG: DUF4097 family beta strand repeat-containing protein [Bryobacteraceae bacterium]
MRQRSITGALIVILVGIFFLVYNVRPDLLAFARIADYWPFFLIAVGVIGLIEVLFHAGRGSVAPPRPIGGGLIFWIVVLCIFLALFGRNREFRFANFDTRGIGFLGTDYGYDVNFVEPAQGVTRIVLDNVRGDFSLKGGDAVEVKVTGHQTIRAFSQNAADRARSGTAVHIEREGDALVIRGGELRAPRFIGNSADLDIVVPRGINVESRGRNGDLEVDDVDGTIDVSGGRGDVRLNHIGKDVRIEASRSGDIHAADVKGSIDLQGRGGDIQIQNILGQVTIKGEFSGDLEFRALTKPLEFRSSRTEFRVEAVPGTVTMDLGDLKMSNISGPVHFQSGTRDIQVTDATELLDINVNRGDIQFTATRIPLPKMEIHTRDGDITLTVPESAGFQIEGSTHHGEIESAFGSRLQVQSSGQTATIRGQNGAGPQITVATDRGSVSIKKT